MSITLMEGRTYKCKNGTVVTITLNGDNTYYPFKGSNGETYTSRGTIWHNTICPNDIVNEVIHDSGIVLKEYSFYKTRNGEIRGPAFFNKNDNSWIVGTNTYGENGLTPTSSGDSEYDLVSEFDIYSLINPNVFYTIKGLSGEWYVDDVVVSTKISKNDTSISTLIKLKTIDGRHSEFSLTHFKYYASIVAITTLEYSEGVVFDIENVGIAVVVENHLHLLNAEREKIELIDSTATIENARYKFVRIPR